MKKLFLLVLTLALVFMLGGCKKEKPEDGNDTGLITEEKWNEIIKDYGFAKDPESSFTASMYFAYPEDLNQPDAIIDKEGLEYRVSYIISGFTFDTYLDYKDFAETGKVHDYQLFDSSLDVWHIFDVDMSIADMFEKLGFANLLNFKDCKFEDGLYKGSYPDEENGKIEVTYKFIDNKFVEYCEYVDEELYFALKLGNYNLARVEFPIAHYMSEMPYGDLAKYVKHIDAELSSYKAITTDEMVAYNHLITLSSTYLRYKNSDDTLKDDEQIKKDIVDLFVKNYFSSYHSPVSKIETDSDNVWLGKIDGSNNIIQFLFEEEDATEFYFSIMDEKVLEVYNFSEYLKEQYSDIIFTYEDYGFLANDDAFIVKYSFYQYGTYDEVLEKVDDVISKYKDLEWSSSSSSTFEHYDTYENDTIAVKVNYITGKADESYQVEVYACVSFNEDTPYTVLCYGLDNPIFN